MEIVNIRNKEDGQNFFKHLKKESGEYGIIFITSDWYKILETEIIKFKDKSLPAIISLPSPTEKEGQAVRNLERLMEKAIGSKLNIKT